jgi:hypothetical protein
MRHGRTILGALILGLVGLPAPARGGEPTDQRLGERTVPIFLLVRPDIQADLKFTPEQVVECRRAALAFQRRASQLIGRKDAAVVAARREIDGELTQWLTERLSTKQLGRFEQIELQWEGAAAMLNRPFLDESLNLTPEQKKLVSQCLEQGKAQRALGTWTYEDHTNLTRKAIAALTDPQRDLWLRLLGPPCPFTIGAQTPPRRSPAPSSASAKPPTTQR